MYFVILGCIREVNTDYKERDFVDEVTLENSQACAEHCASIEGGLFWTFFIKTKKNKRGPEPRQPRICCKAT